jgi:hypothetical protein
MSKNLKGSRFDEKRKKGSASPPSMCAFLYPNVRAAAMRSRAGARWRICGSAATALSLTDLADSIQDVAHIAGWKAYALTVALDANFISTEAFSLFASAAVAKATVRATTATKVITLAMSAVANSRAMAHSAEGAVMQAACVVAGCSVPALIALATFTLGKAVRA